MSGHRMAGSSLMRGGEQPGELSLSERVGRLEHVTLELLK